MTQPLDESTTTPPTERPREPTVTDGRARRVAQRRRAPHGGARHRRCTCSCSSSGSRTRSFSRPSSVSCSASPCRAGSISLQRLRIPRGLGAALIVVTFFGLLVGFGAWMAPTLHAQGGAAATSARGDRPRGEPGSTRAQRGFSAWS